MSKPALEPTASKAASDVRPPATGIKPPAILTPFEHGVIDSFVRMGDVLGFPKSVAEIYGLLFASPRPLAFRDIIDRLKLSKGSASQGLRLLHGNGAIKLVYVAADRRDHYVPETELRALISALLREKIQPNLEIGVTHLEALKKITGSPAFGAGDPEDIKKMRDRLDKLHAWHKRGRAVLPLVTKLFG